MAAFLNHLTSMLKEKRQERLDSLMVRGAPAISNEALERADDVLSEIVSACGTQSREETHPNGNRFVFTYRPNRITYDNEREVKVATKGMLFFHASKASGASDSMLLERESNERQYQSFLASQALQPSRTNYAAITTWGNHGGNPPQMGALNSKLDSGTKSKINTSLDRLGDYAPDPDISVVRALSSDNGVRGVGFPLIWLKRDKFYKALGFNGDDAQLLVDAYEKFENDDLQRAYDYAYKVRNEKLAENGVPLESLPHYASEAFVNYLLAAPNKKATEYRFQVFNIMASKMFDDVSSIKNVDAVENALSRGSNIPYNVLHEIDNGAFPAAEIAKANGFYSLSKNQFNEAMKLLGKHVNVGWRSTDKLVPGSPSSAMAMAKVPKEWLHYNDDIGTIHPSFYHGEGFDFPADVDGVFRSVIPYLFETGKSLDEMASNKDKAGMKKLADKWRWLAKSDGAMVDKLRKFDKQYQISATLQDYPEILDQMLTTIALRIASDYHKVDMGDVVEINDAETSFTLNTDAIEKALFDDIDEENRNIEPDYDEDGEPFYDEMEPASEYMSPLYSITTGTVVKMLAPDIQTVAQRNSALHKGYNDLINHANRNSKLDFSWGTPFENDGPQRIGIYDVKCINTRKALLDEGREMAHCVFSYIGMLAEGDGVVFSVREPETLERLATVKFDIKEPEEEGGRYTLEFDQCYGPHNEMNDTVAAIETQMLEWMHKVNEGEIKVNLDAVKNGKSNTDIPRNIMDDPESFAALTSAIPHTEDGVFMAYFAISEYTPQGQTPIDILSLMSSTWEEVAIRSGFVETVEGIKRVAEKNGISPVGLITLKQSLGVSSFESTQLIQHLNDVKPIAELIGGCVKPGQSRADRVQMVSELLAKRVDGDVTLSAEAAKLLGKPNPDVFVVAALACNGVAPKLTPQNDPSAARELEATLKRVG